MDRYIARMENAKQIIGWLETRGGIAIWGCLDFSDAGKTWTTPLNGSDGKRTSKPHWAATSEPVRVITSVDEVFFAKDVEVKRFRVGVRRATNSMNLKCTDGASRRIRREIVKAGEGAYNVFDYCAQEAVIMRPEKIVSAKEVQA
jgi:hypothetical protein